MSRASLILLALATVMLASVSAFEIEPRIVNGQNSARGQFPFYVWLKVKMPQGTGACGGSLISNEWVVTAAHCLKGAMGIQVHLGSLKAMNTSEKGRIIMEIHEKDVFVHPKYYQFIVLNDIGLIKLPKPVEFSDVIKPIDLACSSKKNMDVVAIGNGLTHTGGYIPEILQYTQLKTMSILKCLTNFPQLLFRSSVICVKGEENRSACNGDSGGPLVSTDNKALFGLTSFGSALGCDRGKPQAFTRVSSYLKWIKEVTGISKCVNAI